MIDLSFFYYIPPKIKALNKILPILLGIV